MPKLLYRYTNELQSIDAITTLLLSTSTHRTSMKMQHILPTDGYLCSKSTSFASAATKENADAASNLLRATSAMNLPHLLLQLATQEKGDAACNLMTDTSAVNYHIFFRNNNSSSNPSHSIVSGYKW